MYNPPMRSRIVRTLLVVLLLSLPAPDVPAEVRHAAPDGFLLHHTFQVKESPESVYKAIGRVDRWWSHSWSNDSSNLTLELRAGGCFCETWPEGSAEHARVVRAIPNETVVLHGALGPLQEMAVAGVLVFQLKPAGGETVLIVTYRVSGDAAHGLDKLAPVVDKVIGEQASRLARYAETGPHFPTLP